jgi:hypothetical protein
VKRILISTRSKAKSADNTVIKKGKQTGNKKKSNQQTNQNETKGEKEENGFA